MDINLLQMDMITLMTRGLYDGKWCFNLIFSPCLETRISSLFLIFIPSTFMIKLFGILGDKASSIKLPAVFLGTL